MGQCVQVDHRSQLLFPPRTQDGEPVPSPTPVGLFCSLCNAPRESVYDPLSFCWFIIWDLFSPCSRCYSHHAKSEIEEVTHVICLAVVCLNTALSAMKMAYTLSFLSHKTKASNYKEAFLLC